MKRCLLGLFVLGLLGCENQESPEPVRVIPDLVKPYLERFELEAARRGQVLDYSKLSFAFEEDISSTTNPGLVVANCSRTEDLHLITIDTTNTFWVFGGDMGREEVVFHELGHCLLQRPHLEEVLPTGDFKSIMRAQGSPSYGNFNPITQNAIIHRRDYYIDELFDISAAIPCWSDPNVTSPYPLSVFESETITRSIGALLVDNANDLWFMSDDQLMLVRDQVLQSVEPGFSVTAIRIDTQGDLWIAGRAGDKGQIGRYQQDVFTLVYQDPEDFGPLYFLNEFYLDHDQRLWLGSSNGLLYIEQEEGTLAQFTEFPNSFIGRLMQGPGNTVIASKGFDLLLFQNREQSPEVLDLTAAGVPNGFIADLEIDQNEEIWMVISGFIRGVDIVRFDLESGTSVTLDLTAVNIPDTFANSLTIDASGGIWLATSNGLRKWEGSFFSNYCQYNTQFPILSIDQVAVDQDGTVWSLGITPEELEPRLVRLEIGI